MYRFAVPVILAATMLAAASSCAVVQLDVEMSEVCVSVDVIAIPGSAESAPLAIEYSLDISPHLHELRDSLDEQGVTSRLELIYFAAHIYPGPTAPPDFGFVDALTVSLPAEADMPEVTLIDCTTCASTSRTIELDLPHIDMLAVTEREVVIVDVSLEGRLPAKPWAMSAELCFRAAVEYDLEL